MFPYAKQGILHYKEKVMNQFNLTLNSADVNLILAVLAKQPLENVFETFNSVRGQVEQQQRLMLEQQFKPPVEEEV